MKQIFQTGALLAVLACTPAMADTAEYINTHTDQALAHLKEHAVGAGEILDNAAGVLVFPDIFKMGFGVGGQYGEGVLLVEGQPVAYYTTAGTEFGLQSDAQFKSEVIVFRTPEALQQFRNKQGWMVGQDGRVVLPRQSADRKLDFGSPDEQVVGFILTDKGLVADLNMDGARITRMAR